MSDGDASHQLAALVTAALRNGTIPHDHLIAALEWVVSLNPWAEKAYLAMQASPADESAQTAFIRALAAAIDGDQSATSRLARALEDDQRRNSADSVPDSASPSRESLEFDTSAEPRTRRTRGRRGEASDADGIGLDAPPPMRRRGRRISESRQRPATDNAEAAEDRVIGAVLNARFTDLMEGRSLRPGVPSELVFDITTERDLQWGVLADDLSVPFPEDAAEVLLTIQLRSDDVDFDVSERPLLFQRDGTSKAPATFMITPRVAGKVRIVATVQRWGNWLQERTLTVPVAEPHPAPLESSVAGRTLETAGNLGARDLYIRFSPAVQGGFDCTVGSMLVGYANLKVSPEDLAASVEKVRTALLTLIKGRDKAFQREVTVTSADRDDALDKLADAGALLMNKLFFGRGPEDAGYKLGLRLIDALTAADRPLKVQFVVDGPSVPWPLLYLAKDRRDPVDWKKFLGFTHDIEEIFPEPATPPPTTIQIEREKGLSVALHFDDTIDAKMKLGVIRRQDEFWEKAAVSAPELRIARRTTRADLMTGIGDDAQDSILYFLCHARAQKVERGSPDDGWLSLTDQEAVSVSELRLRAGDAILQQHPLVFINACESTPLSPRFYAGFTQYFLARGARGVIGTECETPAILADAWARMFFDRMLRGEAIGAAMLHVRRDLLENDNNPLGLVYGLHGDADAYFTPPPLT